MSTHIQLGCMLGLLTGDYLHHLSNIRYYDADWIPAAMCKTLVNDWLADAMIIEH